MKERTCCFFGHRRINDSKELRARISEAVEGLIVSEDVDTFLFGSKSEFDSLCLELVTKLKERYPQIRRIYVRAEYPFIDESYRNYLLKSYDDTYFPTHIVSAGRASYIERNFEMIENSKYCVVYYKEKGTAKKSGTEIAYFRARKKGAVILNTL